jgi:anhydro-N-acetylmuramic acid kinase
MKKYYIGLMSGTSCDGIDCALVRIEKSKIELIDTHFSRFPPELRQNILDLCEPGANAIERLGRCDVELGQQYARSVQQLLNKTRVSQHSIRAIGCHGQTIRHRPKQDVPFTLQIGDPNTLAALTQIDTVADFRRRDIALGGQGAPLMPAFHQALITPSQRPAWVVNIGGMANVTQLLPSRTSGHDTGPGNVLLDLHFQQHHDFLFDRDGAFARRGKCHPILLQQMLNDPYFSRATPKSTGREYFNTHWLDQQLKLYRKTTPAETIQHTLVALTAHSIAAAIHPSSAPVWICGGGVHNTLLMEKLQQQISGPVNTTDQLGIAPDWVEAAGFAWLAHQTIHQQSGNIPTVTGAQRACVLGAVWPHTPHN